MVASSKRFNFMRCCEADRWKHRQTKRHRQEIKFYEEASPSKTSINIYSDIDCGVERWKEGWSRHHLHDDTLVKTQDLFLLPMPICTSQEDFELLHINFWIVLHVANWMLTASDLHTFVMKIFAFASERNSKAATAIINFHRDAADDARWRSTKLIKSILVHLWRVRVRFILNDSHRHRT